MADILKGIKVVEMSTHVAVPKCGRILATWGADVIKVERPSVDPYRYFVPRAYGVQADDDCNPIFDMENANKRGIVLDLNDPDSMEAMEKLLSQADVFLCNTRAKARKKLGLDYETLHAKYPRLICGYLSGYGEKGPEKDRAGFDIQSFWAKSGAQIEWTFKEDRPFKPTPGFGDGVTGVMLTAGVLAALYNREKTGVGEEVNVSLTGAAMFLNGTGIAKGQENIYHGPEVPSSVYGRSPFTPVYRTKDDRWFSVSPNDWDRDVPRILKTFGMDELIGSPYLANPKEANKHGGDLVPIFEKTYAQFTGDELIKLCLENGLQGDVSKSLDELVKDEQGHVNGYLREVEMYNGKTVTLSQVPVDFTEETCADMPLEHAPRLGEDTVEVLKELGFSDEKIKSMIERKAVIAREEK